MIGKSHANFCHHLESVSYRLFTSEIAKPIYTKFWWND